MGNKQSSKLKFRIIYVVIYIAIFLGVIIIPNVINYLRFGSETKEKIEFILNNANKISGTVSYTNYEGKDKKGVVDEMFFYKLTDLMKKEAIRNPYLTREKLEFYYIEITYNNDFFLNCKFDYWKEDNILEIAFFLNDSGYTNRRCYKVTEDEMDQFYNSIITIPNQ